MKQSRYVTVSRYSLGERSTVFLFFMLVGCYLTFSIGSAVAQTMNAATVDFTPLADHIITACIAGLSIAAGVVSRFAVSWFASKTKLNDTEFERIAATRVNDILNRAIDHAEMTAKAYVSDPNSPIKSVKVDNVFIKWGVEYAQKSMPDLIAYFGLTEARIRDMLLARLNGFVTVPEADSGNLATIAAVQPPGRE